MKVELESLLTNFAVGAGVPIGQRGLVHVWGRNDMSSAQQMGISWTVTDPDGWVVEEYSDWEDWPYTGAGGEHEFIGGRFDLDKPGTYIINVGLLMNPDNPVYVDSYYGDLCLITEEYAGTITKKELEYDSVRGDIPVY